MLVEQECSGFPYQDEIRDGESGQGYALRMASSNGLAGMGVVKQLLGRSHSATLGADDAGNLALWFGASVQLLAYALERSVTGRRESGFTYLGQRLGRSYFLTRTVPRICPTCVDELGYCRAAWDVSLCVACVHHERLLVDVCRSCRRSLSWNRPGPAVCSCGFPFVADDFIEKPTPSELMVSQLVAHRVAGYPEEHHAGGGEKPHGESLQRLLQLLRGLSLDGLLRVLYALETAAACDLNPPPAPRTRGSLQKARKTIALAEPYGATVARLELGDCHGKRPRILIDLLCDGLGSFSTNEQDASLAHSMLRYLLGGQSRSTFASKHASLSQGVLF